MSRLCGVRLSLRLHSTPPLSLLPLTPSPIHPIHLSSSSSFSFSFFLLIYLSTFPCLPHLVVSVSTCSSSRSSNPCLYIYFKVVFCLLRGISSYLSLFYLQSSSSSSSSSSSCVIKRNSGNEIILY